MPWSQRPKNKPRSWQTWDTHRDDYGPGWRVHITQFQPGDELRAGKTSYLDTQAGWWIGVDPADGISKLHFGDATNYLKWTGSYLEINGRLKLQAPSTINPNQGIEWLQGDQQVAYIVPQAPTAGAGGQLYINLPARTTGSAIHLIAQTPDLSAAIIALSTDDTTETYPAELTITTDTVNHRTVIKLDANHVHVAAAVHIGANPNWAIGADNLNVQGVYKVNNVQVITSQQAAIANASGGATVDTEARAALNALLAACRTHGLIAT